MTPTIDDRDVTDLEKLFGGNVRSYLATGKRDSLVANPAIDVGNWFVAVHSQDDTVCDRIAELLASRFDTLEDAFDWIIPRTFSHGPLAGYVARVLARRAKTTVPTVVWSQYMSAPAMIALLEIVRAYDEKLLGKYVKDLRGPVSTTKAEKAAILAFEPLAKQYAAALRAASKSEKARADKAAKAARAAVVAAKPKATAPVVDATDTMPPYGRGGSPTAHLFVGHYASGWVKTDVYDQLVAHVDAARASLGLPLVCVPCGDLPAKGKDGYLDASNVYIAVGLEVATARPKQPVGPIEPEAVEAAKRQLAKRVPKEFWARIHELLGDRKPSMKNWVLLLAAGKNAGATLEKGTDAKREVIATAVTDNGWGLKSVELPLESATDELFLRA